MANAKKNEVPCSMEPQQALELLNRICVQVSVNPEGRVRIQEAIFVLSELIQKSVKKGKKADPEE